MERNEDGKPASAVGGSARLFSLERKVRFGFALAATMLALIGALTYLSVLRFRDDSGMVDHTHQVLNTLAKAVSSLTSAESAERGYVITGQPEYLLARQASIQDVDEQLHRLQQLTVDNPTQQHNLNALGTLVAERSRRMQERLEVRRAQGFEAAQSDMVAHGGQNVRDSTGALVTEIENVEGRLLKEREALAQRSGARMRTAIVAGSVVAFGLLGMALFYVGQDFARSRLAEEQLRLAHDTLEERVRERSNEVIKTGVALRAGEERLARILDSAMDAIVTVDEQQRITMFNPAAERMFGCPAADALGVPLERFLPERFRSAHAEHIRGFGQHGVTRRTMGGFSPLSGLRTNGEEFPIEASISQVQVNGGRLFTAIVRDVTETSRARETELEARRHRGIQ